MTPLACHTRAVTHVPWCLPGSLTHGFIWRRWRGKRSQYSRRMCNPQFYVSGKRPIDTHVIPAQRRPCNDAQLLVGNTVLYTRWSTPKTGFNLQQPWWWRMTAVTLDVEANLRPRIFVSPLGSFVSNIKPPSGHFNIKRSTLPVYRKFHGEDDTNLWASHFDEAMSFYC